MIKRYKRGTMAEEVNEERINGMRESILVDLTSNFLAGYSFHFTAIYFDEAIRLKYLVSPPVSGYDLEKDYEFSIWGDAQDNDGNQYTFNGGAYGLSESAPCTDGVLSFVPLPHETAESIEFSIKARKGEKTGAVTFVVPMRTSMNGSAS
jgi:hypothetical protein